VGLKENRLERPSERRYGWGKKRNRLETPSERQFGMVKKKKMKSQNEKNLLKSKD